MGRTIRITVAVFAAVVLLLAGCGDDDATTADPEATDTGTAGADDGGGIYDGPGGGESADGEGAGDGELVVEGFEYQLQPVASGADVGFTNRDSAPHTLTADDGTFDTGSVPGGESTTFTAPAAGEYDVFCTIHPDITGTLVVEE